MRTLLTLAALAGAISSASAAGSVVISQVYGGGGSTNTATLYKWDYVELYNRGSSPASLAGWSLQYASATGTFSSFNTEPLEPVTIPPGRYYLVRMGSSAGPVGADLPVAPDEIGALNLGGTSGKIALVSSTTPLASTSPTQPGVVDYVGYGSANAFEGSGAAPAMTVTTAVLRSGAPRGAVDTDDNASDFTAGTPAPTNSAGGGGDTPACPEVVTVPAYGEITDATVTASSQVNVLDALAALRAVLGQTTLSSDMRARADINRRPSPNGGAAYAAWVGDGSLTMADAARVLDLAVGKDRLNLNLKVTMLNVGHGDGLVIETPSGKKALVDGGYRYVNNDNAANNDTDLVPYLTGKMGIGRLDAIICSHAHGDHVQATADVINALPAAGPGQYCYWSGYNPANKPDQAATNAAAAAKGYTLVAAPASAGNGLAGETLDLDGVTLRMFSTHYPWVLDGDESPRYNNQSIVFRLTYGKASVLFTGDAQGYISSQTEPLGGLHKRLLDETAFPGTPNYGQTLRAQVLKVAHHGSNDGTSGPLLDAVRPDIALMSYKAGYPSGGSYGYPHPETCDLLNGRSIPTYQTTYHGHVLVATDGENIAVIPQKAASTTLVPGRSYVALPGRAEQEGDGCEVAEPGGAASAAEVRL
jgi:beta-lactamase superfamily II metal-dependent hydrolase